LNVRSSTITMSFDGFPSPRPLSGSFEVAETRLTAPTSAEAATVI